MERRLLVASEAEIVEDAGISGMPRFFHREARLENARVWLFPEFARRDFLLKVRSTYFSKLRLSR